MRAIRFAGGREVELIDRPWPEVPVGDAHTARCLRLELAVP